MENRKFFTCKTCGNMVGLIDDKGVGMSCCGSNMTELAINPVGGNVEKHMPVTTFAESGSITVTVGNTAHPMETAHSISFIFVQTEHGGQRKRLIPGETPTATFAFCDDKPVAVYAYCNLHGLWKADL